MGFRIVGFYPLKSRQNDKTKQNLPLVSKLLHRINPSGFPFSYRPFKVCLLCTDLCQGTSNLFSFGFSWFLLSFNFHPLENITESLPTFQQICYFCETIIYLKRALPSSGFNSFIKSSDSVCFVLPPKDSATPLAASTT